MLLLAFVICIALEVATAANYSNGSQQYISPDAPPGEISIAFQTDIKNIPGKSLVGILVKYPEGGATGSHRHAPSSFINGYVLSGAILSQVEGEPAAKVYQAGQYFVENPGAHHIVSANAAPNGGASSLLAVFVVNTNETNILVIPDKTRR